MSDPATLQRRLRIMTDASHAFAAASGSYPELLRRIVRQVADQIGESCSLRLIAEDGRHFENVAFYNADPAIERFMAEVVNAAPQAITEGFSGLVVQRGQAVMAPAITPEQARATVKPAYHAILERIGLTSGLAVPLAVHGRMLGVLFLVRHNPPGRPYDAEDLALLQDLADRAALALDGARLRLELARREEPAGGLLRFRSLFEHAGDAILLTGTEGRILAANPAACELFGYPEHELCRLGRSAVVDPTDARLGSALAERARTGGFRGALTLVRSDGSRFEGHVVSRTFGDAAAGLQTAMIVRDETARHQAIAAMARLAAIVTHSEDAILGVDPHGLTVQAWNRAAEALFGYPAAEMIGQPVERLIPADRLAEFRDHIAVVRDGEAVTSHDTERLGKGGERLEVSVTAFPVRDAGGHVTGYAAIMRDVSARRRTEAALAASEARHRTLLDAMPDLVLIVDGRGRIVLVNSQLERALGYRREELIGRSFEALIPARYRPGHASQVLGFFAEPQVRAMGAGRELFVRRRDGTELPVEIGLSPVGAGEARMAIATLRDVSERKAAMAVHAAQAAELAQQQQLNALKDHFLSTISHEIRTPLTLIQGFAELLEDKYPDEALLAGIQEGSRRLTDRFQAILTYSALVAGSLQLYRCAVDAHEAAEQAITATAERYQQRGIAVRLDMPALPPIQADPPRLVQILAALLENAANATPAGGQVLLAASQRGNFARIEVHDDGPGVPPAEAERIWQAFSQTRIGDAERPDGLGLGLALVRGLVELHGGQAGLTLPAGGGCRFYVELPLVAG